MTFESALFGAGDPKKELPQGVQPNWEKERIEIQSVSLLRFVPSACGTKWEMNPFSAVGVGGRWRCLLETEDEE